MTSAYDALAELNPFRYRGYVWDEDTERYYVSSRYYKPELIRWSNADGYVSTGQSFIGCNMYAYCNNNPVIFKDLSGNRAIFTYICLGVMLTGVAIGLGGCSSNDDVEPYSHYANCYAYAMKLERDPRTGAPFSSKPQPGDFSNNRLVREDLIGEPDVVKDNIMSKVHTDSVYLGLTIIEVDSVDYETHDESWLVALVYASDGTDYHWYRRDDDGIWSHKMGVTPVTRWDNSGNAITNPELCDRGIYDIFLGYYEVSLSNGG